MENHSWQNFVLRRTLISLLIAIMMPFVGLIIEFLHNPTHTASLQGIITIYSEDPAHWVLLFLLIFVPAATFILSNKSWSIIKSQRKEVERSQTRTATISRFVQKLINDDYSEDFRVTDETDMLGKALNDLRQSLKENVEMLYKQQGEDELRRWVAEGLAKFGDILRMNSNNLETLAFSVTRDLVKYIRAIQGSFYLLEIDNLGNKYFKQTALFAYDRKKFADQIVKWGDGLIGTCAMEQQTIYRTKLPQSYVSITSGLGQANPKSLLLLPLVANEEIFGVLEIASLNEIEPHEISFAERVAENTAATIGSVRLAERTTKLLEESRSRAQTMVSQEEEMRQNMEELMATQEELARQADKFVKLENTVNHTMIRADYNLNGTLLYANTKFLKKLEYLSNSDVEGKNISMFIGEKDKEWFARIWEDLAKGGRHFEGYMKHVTQNGKDLWTMATYTCIRGEDEEVEKVLFLAIDTTEHKKLSLKVEGIVEAVDKSSIKLELSSNGNITETNENAVYTLGYDEKELAALTIFDLIDKIELDNFSNKWDTVVRGIGFQGQFKFSSKAGITIWLRGAFSAIYDMYGDVTRVLFVGHDNTNEKQMEMELRNQTDILKQQEKLLRESEKELSRKLREARLEMQNQYKEIEHIKIRNERTLEGALDAIVTTSNDNKILFFNNAAEELWGFSKNNVLGKDISALFNEKLIKEDEFLTTYTSPGDVKIVGVRKEIKIFTKQAEEKPVLILLSKAHVENEITYTAFIQNIEVELF